MCFDCTSNASTSLGYLQCYSHSAEQPGVLKEGQRGSGPSTGKNGRDSVSTENPLDYFARAQSKDFDLFFSIPPKTNLSRVSVPMYSIPKMAQKNEV